ncbi:GNAT family N-acetyltransferase [Neptunicella marina]|uniref:GNAT family N-acetyltransferase n=1 Tax=Neptunicella marina TaxID=2125989 RepID=A0A8J6IRR0_9ALTE|nr:GNAT family N-acetyltransferase [Neptunicella marina]MBC3765184.1 GNAT family N-acetyltransferase [Neptunicella marina]
MITYQPLSASHFDALLTLGNAVHGDNYLDRPALEKLYELGFKNGINASWVALNNGKLVGFRLTVAPGNWQADKWCSPDLWPFDISELCYFKCNTVDPDCQGQGIGSGMLERSCHSVNKQGGKGGIAHIWLASPGNSAFKYFSANGGVLVKEHPGKWLPNCIEEGYICPICGSHCECVAAEMLLYFDDK